MLNRVENALTEAELLSTTPSYSVSEESVHRELVHGEIENYEKSFARMKSGDIWL